MAMLSADEMREVVTRLAPVEVFDYYDGPRFYSCRDVAGQLYLVYWVDESEQHGSSWLYLKVSPERYAAVKRGHISVAEALSNPEEGLVFLVSGRERNLVANRVEKSQIEAEWLPDNDYRLELDEAALPSKSLTAKDLAQRAHRQVLDIAFEKASNTYEMAAGKLGRVLDSLQNTIYALSCPPDMALRRVPEEVKFRSEVLVTGLFASSFGVRLQTRGSDLFGNDDTAAAIESLTKLFATMGKPDVVTEHLRSLNVLARSRFKHLLHMLVDAHVAVKADWGNTDGRELVAHATYDELSQILRRIEATENASTQIVERDARLVGVDVQSDFFALVIEEGEVIKGKLARALATRHFEVPSVIRVKIEETCVIDPLTDKEKWSYVLLDVL
jgi:hypothetical protein